MPMRMLGYEMAHHGEGRWNGVAILSKVGIEDVVTNFGDGPVRDSTGGRRGRGQRGRLRPVRRGADGVRGVRRDPVRLPLRAERARRRVAVLRGQAALVRAGPSLARRDPPAGRAARHRRGLQRDAGARGRLERGPGPRRDPRVAAGARGAGPAPRVGAGGRLPVAAARARAVLVVGLPGGHVPPQRGDADRPPVSHRAGGGPRGVGRDRSRGAQGPADALGPRAGRPGPGRARARRSMPAGPARWSGSPRARSRGGSGAALRNSP